jgi:hypothetical protein
MSEASSIDPERQRKRRRSALSKDDARQRYVETGALVALEQIRHDAQALDRDALAIGPFARLDAGAVAARDGKTRGAINNLFGSQAAYQVATMSMALDAGDAATLARSPDPADFADAGAWVEALFAGQAACGPQHGAEPEMSYAALWVLWLGAVPYGLWSERVAEPSVDEFVRRVGQLEAIFAQALDRFGLTLREGTALADLACGAASLIEGVWLSQCLTRTHPRAVDRTIADALVRSGRLLWNGAVAQH